MIFLILVLNLECESASLLCVKAYAQMGHSNLRPPYIASRLKILRQSMIILALS